MKKRYSPNVFDAVAVAVVPGERGEPYCVSAMHALLDPSSYGSATPKRVSRLVEDSPPTSGQTHPRPSRGQTARSARRIR